MGKKFTKLIGIVLVAAMLLPLIPSSLANSADDNPYPYLVYGTSGVVKKNEVINQITNLTDYYYECRTDSRGFKDPWYVTGAQSVWFVSCENNGGTWSSDMYIVPLPNANITPGLTLKSGNGGDWNIKFENKGVYYKNYVDPEAEIVISCKFSNNQGYIKIGNTTVSGKGRKEIAVKIKDAGDQLITIGGNKKTKVNGMYGYVRDNTSAYIKSVDVNQVGTDIVVTAKASEGLKSFGANDASIDEWNRTYVDVTINNARTGTGTTVLRAYIYRVDEDTLTFKAPLGDWINKDYNILKLSPSTLKTIDGETSYTHRELIYNYSWERGVSEPGCRAFKSFDIATRSTFLCDIATNPLSLGNIARTVNKTIDNTTPSVTGVSISVPGKILNTNLPADKTQWPDDIKLSDLYGAVGDKVYFTVTTDEALSVYEDIKLSINVNDENGRQVVLDMSTISTVQTTYGIPQSVIEFGPMTIKEGYHMMSGYEDQTIRSLGLTYKKAQDGAGHNLITTGLGKPDQQFYLDFIAPTVTVTKLDYPTNSPHASFKIDVSDKDSGIAGAPGVITLKGKSEAGITFRYLISDSMTAPTDATAYGELVQLSGDSTVQVPFTCHGQNDYTTYVHLFLEPGVEQIVNEVTASATAEDILGNNSASENCTSDYTYDNVKPITSIGYLKANYSWSGAEISTYFEGTDHHNIVSTQYLLLVDDDTVPNDDTSGAFMIAAPNGTIPLRDTRVQAPLKSPWMTKQTTPCIFG